MGTELAKELAALDRLPMSKLRDRYAEAFGESPSGNSRPWLVRRLAWRLQERALGSLGERMRKRAGPYNRPEPLFAVCPSGTKSCGFPGPYVTHSSAPSANRTWCRP